MKRELVFALLTVFIVLLNNGCISHNKAESVLLKAYEKVESSKTIEYNYLSHWDTRLNETIFENSSKIFYSKSKQSPQGFAFQIVQDQYESIFNGFQYLEIDHDEQLIIHHDSTLIQGDSSYFLYSNFFAKTPFALPIYDSIASSLDTTIGSEHYYRYHTQQKVPSMDGSGKIVQRDQYYYINVHSFKMDQVQEITIIEGDTAQIINHSFHNLEFKQDAKDIVISIPNTARNYAEVNSEDLMDDRLSNQIKVGTQLEFQYYRNIKNEQVSLFKQKGKSTLIMFSFIGCGACEYALREMKDKDYKVNQDINFYYSSPHDKAKTLSSYIEKKQFPYSAFAKESNMHDVFTVYSFPTFVLIDEHGMVKNVSSGFGQEIKDLMFID